MSRALFGNAAVRRIGGTAALAIVAIGLVHMFLIRLPHYLVTAKAPATNVVPLAAPDWGTSVETERPLGHGSGSGTAGSGVPAAPALR